MNDRVLVALVELEEKLAACLERIEKQEQCANILEQRLMQLDYQLGLIKHYPQGDMFGSYCGGDGGSGGYLLPIGGGNSFHEGKGGDIG